MHRGEGVKEGLDAKDAKSENPLGLFAVGDFVLGRIGVMIKTVRVATLSDSELYERNSVWRSCDGWLAAKMGERTERQISVRSDRWSGSKGSTLAARGTHDHRRFDWS